MKFIAVVNGGNKSAILCSPDHFGSCRLLNHVLQFKRYIFFSV